MRNSVVLMLAALGWSACDVEPPGELGLGVEVVEVQEPALGLDGTSGDAQRARVPERSIPVMGAGLAVHGDLAVATDPDHHRVVFVDLPTAAVEAVVELRTADVPNRLVVTDDAAYVVLRGPGAVARIDRNSHEVVARQPVCAEPRGIAVDGELLRVACAGGDLVTLDSALDELERWEVDTDLRDVVPTPAGLWVSRFAAAEALLLDRDTGQVLRRDRPAVPDRTTSVAWRMEAAPGGGVVLLHQSGARSPIETSLFTRGDYYADDAIHHHATCFEDPPVTDEPDEPTGPQPDPSGGEPDPDNPGCEPGTWGLSVPLPVDLTFVSHELCVASASASLNFPRVAPVDTAGFFDPSLSPCVDPGPDDVWRDGPGGQPRWPGVIVAIEASPYGTVSVHRAPFGVLVGRDAVDLAGGVETDPEIELALVTFHFGTTGLVACASCHPEGQQDGLTWLFVDENDASRSVPRRTPLVAGRLLDRAPFHWDADLEDLSTLMDDVFVGGMVGPAVRRDEVASFGDWMHGLRPVRPAARGDVALGEVLFHEAGCPACHVGEVLTDNEVHDVARAPVKTPSLIGVGARGPWMHDGCAETLMERFVDEDCGGGAAHGDTAEMSTAELEALIAYLQSL